MTGDTQPEEARTRAAMRRSLVALRLEVPAEVAVSVEEHVRAVVEALEARAEAAERALDEARELIEMRWTLDVAEEADDAGDHVGFTRRNPR